LKVANLIFISLLFLFEKESHAHAAKQNINLYKKKRIG
jgi:hypothetical protein